MTEGRVILERDDEVGIARLTLDSPARRNAYDPAMRAQLAGHLDTLADDDAIKVVHLRGAGGVFSTGADMGNAYSWYGDTTQTRGRRPSQRRRLAVDRRTFSLYHDFLGYPKATIAEVSGYALGGPRRTTPGLPRRRSHQLPHPRLRHQPPIRGRRIQLRQTRAQHGTKRAFQLRDTHFHTPTTPNGSE